MSADVEAEVQATVAIWRIRAGGMELSPNGQAPHLLRLILAEDVRIVLERDADDAAEQAAAMRELARLAIEAAEDLESRIAARAQCPDPDPCLHGPSPHQRHPTCQADRDSSSF